MLLAWVLFPLALLAIGAGWGALVERASGARVPDPLLVPVGLAAALVVAGTFTAFSATAPAAAPIVAAAAGAGLIVLRPFRRLPKWAALAALGVLLAYGAPVLLSGQATFTGFVRLDDTSTWFNVIDHAFSSARSVAGEPHSTYSLVFTGDVGPSYPFGAFMLAGVGRALVGIDIAWAFAPYLACCAAALSLSLYALMAPVVSSPRIRAAAAFAGAQPALLYGYALWGGIKEMTAAFLLALGVALLAAQLERPPGRWRSLLPLAVACGALIQTLGPGAAGWAAPALLALLLAWGRRARAEHEPDPTRRRARIRSVLRPLAQLAALTATCLVPIWLIIGSFFSNKGGLFAGMFSSGQTQATRLGNLLSPLRAFQLAGIWPVGDFRFPAPTASSAPLIALALLAAAATLAVTLRRRQFGIALYTLVALSGCGIIYLSGGTPWVTGKALAISSPALLAAALAGAAGLWSARTRGLAARGLGLLVVLALAGGALWSNALGYGDATLAPRPALAELEHIGSLLHGSGPTFVNAYEIYADRHFLRAGAPVEPAEYRETTLPLRDGAILTKAAAADLDSFPLPVLAPYPSLVTPHSPVESRPPSNYSLVWQGRFYALWQRAAHPAGAILAHIPLGESNSIPSCGAADGREPAPLCSIDPVAIPSCAQIRGLAAQALHEHADLVAYEREAPIVVRGDQTLWPGAWLHDPAGHSLTPTTPGTAVSHIVVASDEDYELWLGGSFTRGFRVSVDGRPVGRAENELASINGYVEVARIHLTPGVHTFALTFPGAGLAPGSAEHELTSLSAIALEPKRSPSRLLTLAPTRAEELCTRSLDWIELVARA